MLLKAFGRQEETDRLLRRFAALVLVQLSLSFAICGVFAEEGADQKRRPNVILILADDKAVCDL